MEAATRLAVTVTVTVSLSSSPSLTPFQSKTLDFVKLEGNSEILTFSNSKLDVRLLHTWLPEAVL
jgi:hypothetical protein